MTDTNSYAALSQQYGTPGGEHGDPVANPTAGSRRSYQDMHPSELVKMQDKWFQRVTEQRRHVERNTLLGTAFLLDQQYVDFLGSHQGAHLVQTPAKKGRVRTVEQIIEPAYRGEHARLLRSRPVGVTIPDGVDPEDFESAEAADQLLAHISRTYKQETYTERGVSWQITGGTALLGVTWDSESPDPDGVPGKFVFRALSPFEFGVPHPRTEDLEDQPYVMVTKTYELDEIEDRWGVRVKPDAAGSYGSLDDRLSSVISGGTTSGKGSASAEQAIVKETWVKPNPATAPEGLVLITAGGEVLSQDPWPAWTSGQYPFYPLKFIPIPGSFWGKGLLQALIPLQRRHNRAASIIIEHQNILSQIGIAAPRGTTVRGVLGGRATLYESPPGATVPVTNVQAPPVGDLPFRELEHTTQAVRDISYQHEVSKGYTPPNVRSGNAISMLKEMDDSASSIPIRHIERALEHISNHVLRIVKQYWDEPRLIKVLSQDGDLERTSFVGGGDIGGQFAVQAGSAWPYTKAEKQAMILQLLDRQLITPDETLQHLDMGTSTKGIRAQREVEYRHARRENQKYEALALTRDPQTGDIGWTAPPPAPEDWHNHLAHLEIHNTLRKSPKYEAWPDHKKRIFEAHILGHTAAIYAQIANNPEMAGGPAGAEQPAPAGPEGPAGPEPEPEGAEGGEPAEDAE